MQLQRAKNMNQTRKRASIMGARDMMHLVSRSKAAVTEPTATRREFAPDRAKRVRTDPPQRSPENIEKRPANLEASLALGPPGPIAAPQYAPAPWPRRMSIQASFFAMNLRLLLMYSVSAMFGAQPVGSAPVRV